MEYGNEEHLDLRQRKTRKLLVEALAQRMAQGRSPMPYGRSAFCP